MYELTNLESLQNIFSDIHKDVYGYRPRSCSEAQWSSEEWLESEIKYLDIQLKEQMLSEREEELIRIKEFEVVLTNLINSGAGNRKTAVRWFLDANTEEMGNGGTDYLCYLNGLPYGYFEKEMSA